MKSYLMVKINQLIDEGSSVFEDELELLCACEYLRRNSFDMERLDINFKKLIIKWN